MNLGQVAPESNDYLYQLFRKIGLSTFGARTAQFFLEKPLTVVLIALAAVILSRLGSRLARSSVEALVSRSPVQIPAARAARARTLAGVVASLVRILVWSIAALLILDSLGVNLGPLLAGASIVGVAVGFGAQSLVRDFLSGFFLLAEDQYGVGDLVTVVDVTATVEEVNLRVTRLRGADGTVWFVPNGEIRKVGNSAKDWSKAIVDLVVPPAIDVAAGCAAIARELASLADDPEWSARLLEPAELLGVESIGPEGATVRVAAKTSPDARATVARELRARVLARLQADGLTAVAVPEPGGAVPSSPLPPAAPDAGGGTD